MFTLIAVVVSVVVLSASIDGGNNWGVVASTWVATAACLITDIVRFRTER